MARAKGSTDSPVTNITAEHIRRFNAIRDREIRNIALLSCFINEKPGCAIVLAEIQADGGSLMTPLFVSVTDDMVLTDHEGNTTRTREEIDANGIV